jgi:hypothetical protein
MQYTGSLASVEHLTNGDGRCGETLRLKLSEGRLLRIQNENLATNASAQVRSFDFWFRLGPAGVAISDVYTLMSKDGEETGQGDLQIQMLRLENAGPDGYHIKVRIQHPAADPNYSTTSYLCSEPIILPLNWHHLALSMDGVEAKLFVDGVEINKSNSASNFPLHTQCSIHDELAHTATLQNNNHDWFFGANNAETTPSEFLEGDIDEIRFRNRGFTQQEAQSVVSFDY